MDIFQALKKDHAEAKSLMKKLEKIGGQNGAERDDLFSQLRQGLELHSAIEEKLFYPALKDNDTTHDLVLESLEEHHVVKQLLEELQEVKDNEQWHAKFCVLVENVQHHIEEEEEDLFKKANKVFTKQQAKELGDRAVQEKEAAMALH